MDQSKWMRLVEAQADRIIERVDFRKVPFLIGIDGRCASGKTTISAVLARRTGWPVVHLDDFFLRPEQRTPERYAEPGGNVDRERLLEEVILPLEQQKPVSYQKFDCSTMKLGETLTIPNAQVIVLEGSYALHPALRDHYQLRVFLDVEAQDQLNRIEARSGAEKRKVFEERWIPLEEQYFSFYDVSSCADLRINTSMPEQK